MNLESSISAETSCFSSAINEANRTGAILTQTAKPCCIICVRKYTASQDTPSPRSSHSPHPSPPPLHFARLPLYFAGTTLLGERSTVRAEIVFKSVLAKTNPDSSETGLQPRAFDLATSPLTIALGDHASQRRGFDYKFMKFISFSKPLK